MVDGFSFPHLTKRVNIAGRHITRYLVELLKRRGYALNRTTDFDTVRQLKEQTCFVALDYKQESRVSSNQRLSIARDSGSQDWRC